MNEVTIEDVLESDGPMLAELRAKAMKPSLQNIGRFDEDRVRNRFLRTFNPIETKKITMANETIAFYVIRQKDDHMLLEHLYIDPGFQKTGIGHNVLSGIKTVAIENCLPIRPGALRASRANEFYKTNGFSWTHEDEFDVYYEWTPR